tara:strand:+ start:531 stop:1328 length:798 start_codon:yes stop_codon:yes gene_type:complete
MAIFKNQIEDIAGTIPGTADAEQFLVDGVTDVVHKMKKLYPEHLPLFAKDETIIDAGTALHDTDVLDVRRGAKSCRPIQASGRHAADDVASLGYASADDPVYYFLNGKIFVKPTGSTSSCSVVQHGAITNWDSSPSSIAYMPDENYIQVIMYAAIQVLHHKMVIFENDTGFPATALTTMTDSDWTQLDYDFDDENIDYNTWFQALGDMIQNQEDVELASIQMQKLQTFFAGDQQQLQKIVTRYQWMQGQLASVVQQYNASFMAGS